MNQSLEIITAFCSAFASVGCTFLIFIFQGLRDDIRDLRSNNLRTLELLGTLTAEPPASGHHQPRYEGTSAKEKTR